MSANHMTSAFPRRAWLAAAVLCGSLVWAPALPAQEATQKKIPDPQSVQLTTKDMVTLSATYYPSLLGKSAVPVIMLHGWEGRGSEFHPLAKSLQEVGHAVLVPDLRGHGESNTQYGKPLTMTTVSRSLPMLAEDVETCKRYLIERNNAGELNIDKLVVVAAEESCVVAMNWATGDWAFPTVGGVKQGQDVKALVLISPSWRFRTLSVADVIKLGPLQNDISAYILVGRQGSAFSDAKKIHDTLEAGRRKTSRDQDLFMLPVDTRLQGTKILALQNADLTPYIAKFIDTRAAQREFPWAERGKVFQ